MLEEMAVNVPTGRTNLPTRPVPVMGEPAPMPFLSRINHSQSEENSLPPILDTSKGDIVVVLFIGLSKCFVQITLRYILRQHLSSPNQKNQIQHFQYIRFFRFVKRNSFFSSNSLDKYR
jgi:hypothetical protein